MVFNTVEFSLQLSNFQAVSIHLVTIKGPIFVNLINDKGGVTMYQEAFNAELDGYTETVETSFILSGIVGGWKMNPEDIPKFVSGWREKEDACPSTIKVEGAVEVHDLMLGSVG